MTIIDENGYRFACRFAMFFKFCIQRIRMQVNFFTTVTTWLTNNKLACATLLRSRSILTNSTSLGIIREGDGHLRTHLASTALLCFYPFCVITVTPFLRFSSTVAVCLSNCKPTAQLNRTSDGQPKTSNKGCPLFWPPTECVVRGTWLSYPSRGRANIIESWFMFTTFRLTRLPFFPVKAGHRPENRVTVSTSLVCCSGHAGTPSNTSCICLPAKKKQQHNFPVYLFSVYDRSLSATAKTVIKYDSGWRR